MKIRKLIEDSDMEYKSGSKIWPSDDPEDSCFDDFVCKYCGHTESFQACGTFYEGMDSAKSQSTEAKERMIKHFGKCSKWPMVEISGGEINALILEKLDMILSLRMV